MRLLSKIDLEFHLIYRVGIDQVELIDDWYEPAIIEHSVEYFPPKNNRRQIEYFRKRCDLLLEHQKQYLVV